MEEHLRERFFEETNRLSSYSTTNERRARLLFLLSIIILVVTWVSHYVVPQFFIITFAMSSPSRDEIDTFAALSAIQFPSVPYYVFVFPLAASITFASLAALQSGVSRKRLIEMLSPLASMARKTTGK